MDLRCSLEEEVNAHLKENVASFDIFCFSFVLHENRSYCEQRDEHDNVIGVRNSLLEILQRAKINSVIIALDSGNRLMNNLLTEAVKLGWEGERPKKQKMGCANVIQLIKIK